MPKRMLDVPLLRVMEDGATWTYRRQYSESGYPYYACPDEKNQLHKKFFCEEILFLPIEYEDYKSNREDYFYGYRFLIATPGHTTISAIPGLGLPNSKMEIQISFEVARIRYFMEDDHEHDIVIDFMGDAVFPTRTVAITQDPVRITETINHFLRATIDELCTWYANRKI